ncbi:hypothetical protein DBV15_00253 [Temnothorax longispinosus]|uniref:Uncharacterized protein n=1 Tax=Temnothorax longispinosus TaxID=300112 RepID=A0A4S2KVZ7_9HYME|nr:hypothetical protein DBV15_00253 [Temnothorax longispinosus]
MYVSPFVGFAKPRTVVQEHIAAASAIASVEVRLHVVGSCPMQFMIIFNPVTARRVYVEREHTLVGALGRGAVDAASRLFRSDCVVVDDVIQLQPRELTNATIFFFTSSHSIVGYAVGLARDQSSARVTPRSDFVAWILTRRAFLRRSVTPPLPHPIGEPFLAIATLCLCIPCEPEEVRAVYDETLSATSHKHHDPPIQEVPLHDEPLNLLSTKTFIVIRDRDNPHFALTEELKRVFISSSDGSTNDPEGGKKKGQQLRITWKTSDRRRRWKECTIQEYKYRFDRLAKLVGHFAASPSSFTHENSQNRDAQVARSSKRIAVSKDGEKSEEREVAQTWKDRICVPVRFLLRGSATCFRPYIRALNASAPIDHESANRVPSVMFAERRGDVRNISLPINARERERGTCERISRENEFPSHQITSIDWKYIVAPSKINGTPTKCKSREIDEVEARIDQSTCEIRPNGKGNSGFTVVNRCDRSIALKRRRTSRVRRVERRHRRGNESCPEGPSAGKEEDAEAGGHVHLYFLPSREISDRGAELSRVQRIAKQRCRSLSRWAGKLITSRSLYHALRKRDLFEQEGGKGTSRSAFFKTIRENRKSSFSWHSLMLVLTARQRIIFKLHMANLPACFSAPLAADQKNGSVKIVARRETIQKILFRQGSRETNFENRSRNNYQEYQNLYREQGEMKLSVSAYTAQASAHKNLCSYQRSYGATNQASSARTPSDLATVLPGLKPSRNTRGRGNPIKKSGHCACHGWTLIINSALQLDVRLIRLETDVYRRVYANTGHISLNGKRILDKLMPQAAHTGSFPAPQLPLIALRTFAHKVPLRDERFERIGTSGIYQPEQARNSERYVRCGILARLKRALRLYCTI